MRFRRLVVVGIIIAALAAVGAARAEPAKIRGGYAVVPANLLPLLDAAPGVVRHKDKSYTLELTRFAGTPQQMAGFAAGEIDIGSMSFSTFAIAVQNAGLEDTRIIADIMQDGAHGSNSNEMMVLKDGPVRRVEDLAGKAFGTIGAGGSSDLAMRVILRRHGLDDKTAVTYVDVAFPNMKAMLLSHKVDVITAVTPFSMDPELRANARTLFTQADVLGPVELLMMVCRAGFLARNHAAMVDFLEDYLRAVRWYTDPANHRRAVEIVAAFNKRPVEFYDSWAFTKTGDQYRDPDALPDLASAQKSIELQHEFGLLKASVEIAKYAELSLVKEAAGGSPPAAEEECRDARCIGGRRSGCPHRGRRSRAAAHSRRGRGHKTGARRSRGVVLPGPGARARGPGRIRRLIRPARAQCREPLPGAGSSRGDDSSNIVENGRVIGFVDAGQGWHTDVSYSATIALATVLHARRVPVRDGRALGNTEFRNMHLAYAELPASVKARIEGRRAIHDFDKFWEMMRARAGSIRKPLTPEQRSYRPPVAQPIVRIHPITGRKVLYCNPGYAMRIEGMEQDESDALLEYLFAHQAQDKYLHAHGWREGDVLMWDDIGTTHNAVADYGPDEPRFMYRVQVLVA